MSDFREFIDDQLRTVEYGVVTFTIKKHDNQVSSTDSNKTTMLKVKDNVQALTMVGTLIKAVQNQIIQETKDQDPHYTPPNLTFTIFFHKDGQAERVHVNDFKRKTFK